MKRLFCLSIALVFALCGCGTDTPPDDTSPSTTRSTAASTSAVSDHHTTTPFSTIAPSIPSVSTQTTLTTDTSTATQDASHTTTIVPSTTTQPGKTSSATADTTTVSTSPSTSIVPTTRPNTTFTATVRNDQQQTIGGVTVTVWTSDDVMIGQGITDNRGVARITLADYPVRSYRVTLGNLPTGYEANAFYSFSTTMVNITIRKAAVQNEQDHSQARYEEGRKMTNFSLTDIDGNSYRLSSLLEEKQLIVLDFWYTTCEPCKMEFPYFESAVQKYGDKFTLLAVNPINDIKAMASLRQQLNAKPHTAISFPMLKDTCNLYLGFGVNAYPTTVFIDSNGVILDIHKGAYASEEAFLATVERYLR